MRFGKFPDLYSRFPSLTAGSRIGVIATIPRSGTWALQYLMGTFDSLIKNTARANPFDIAFSHLPEIGLDLLSIGHHYCPGLARIGGQRYRQWQALAREPLPGWDWASSFLARYAEYLDPDSRASVRIVIVYRNPLDQAVSFCRQMLQPFNSHYAGAIRADDGVRVDVGNVSEFLRRVGAANYVRYFISYWWGRELWNERLKFVRYEDLIYQREETLESLITFLRGPLNAAEQDAFRRALELTSARALRELESQRNRSIGDPGERAHGTNHRHIMDGRAGTWREVLRPEDAEFCRTILAEWNIPLEAFRFDE